MLSSKPIPQIPIQLTGHTRPITKTVFNKSGNPFLLSCSKDKTAMIRDGNTGDWIGNLSEHKGAIWDCVLSNDASISVTGFVN